MGISPPTIFAENLLQNVPHVETIRILREFYDKDQIIEVVFDGADARFLQGDSEFLMPAGMREYFYELTILPKQAAVGQYAARVDFNPAEPDEQITDGTGVAIRRGVSLILAFSVTGDELVDYAIANVGYLPVEENGDLITTFDVENEGNVEWRPDSVVITITDPVTGEVVGTETIAGTELTLLSSGETLTITQLLSLKLPVGNFVATADFIYGGVVVYTQTNNLEVLAAGTLSQLGEFTNLKVSKDAFYVGELAQLVGYFSNLGETPYVAQMQVEIYDLKANTLYQTLESDSLTVQPGAKIIFESTATLDRAGDYRAVAFVNYGKKQSGTQQVTFKVESTSLVPTLPTATLSGWPTWLTVAIGSLAGLILFFIIFLLIKRRKINPPVVNAPIYPNSPQISGTAKAKNGSAVEVYLGDQQIGTALVEKEQWTYTAKPGELQVGLVVKAILRIDSNRDGKIDLSDRSSKPSHGVTISQTPAAPVAPAINVVPAAATVVVQAPAPAPSVAPAQPIVQSTAPVSSKASESSPTDENWTISL
jgi:hypothetical protein